MSDERVDTELQKIAEDFVLAWIGRPSTAAAAQLHQHLRDQRAEGEKKWFELVRWIRLPLEDAVGSKPVLHEVGAPSGNVEVYWRTGRDTAEALLKAIRESTDALEGE